MSTYSTENNQAELEVVRSFIAEYFDAGRGTNENQILAYFSDDVVLRLPTETLDGKVAVRANFVRPFIAAFPGNVHANEYDLSARVITAGRIYFDFDTLLRQIAAKA